MHIHFICSGNAYRSRLAEAYCRSITNPEKIKISSSGIGAKKHAEDNGPISWYAMRIIKRNNLIPYMSWKEQQTTKKVIMNVDLLICMNQIHLDYCQNKLGYNKSFEVWNIQDLNEMDEFIPSNTKDVRTEINHIKLSEQTYSKIVDKINNLVSIIEQTKIDRNTMTDS